LYPSDAVIAVAVLFLACFFVQAAVVIPDLPYFFPAYLCLVLWAGAALELGARILSVAARNWGHTIGAGSS
jgi:hypothetical protein